MSDLQFAVLSVCLILFYCYIYMYHCNYTEKVEKISRRHSYRAPEVQKTMKVHDTSFPLSHYIPEFGNGQVGYVTGNSKQYPLLLKRFFNKWYYYTSGDNEIQQEFVIPGNPNNSKELFDGDTVTLNGDTYTVKLNRTSL